MSSIREPWCARVIEDAKDPDSQDDFGRNVIPPAMSHQGSGIPPTVSVTRIKKQPSTGETVDGLDAITRPSMDLGGRIRSHFVYLRFKNGPIATRTTLPAPRSYRHPCREGVGASHWNRYIPSSLADASSAEARCSAPFYLRRSGSQLCRGVWGLHLAWKDRGGKTCPPETGRLWKKEVRAFPKANRIGS